MQATKSYRGFESDALASQSANLFSKAYALEKTPELRARLRLKPTPSGSNSQQEFGSSRLSCPNFSGA
jgi:hypothetical protein